MTAIKDFNSKSKPLNKTSVKNSPDYCFSQIMKKHQGVSKGSFSPIRSAPDDISSSDWSLRMAFERLQAAVERALEKAIFFWSILRALKSTLKSIEPAINDLDSDKLVKDPSEMNDLVEVMRYGVELVGKCSSFGHRHIYKKNRYSKKLQKLEDDIVRLFQVHVQLIASRNIKDTLAEVKNLRMVLRKLSLTDRYEGNSSFEKASGGFGSFAPPLAPDFVVGLDVSYQSLKKQVIVEGFCLTVVSGPGGFGKTTLVKKLCHDQEIKGKFKDNIFFVHVSRSPSSMMIRKLIYCLGEDSSNIKSEDEAESQLQQLLAQISGPILMVFDDIWPQSESFLEKFALTALPNCKILVTSRFEFPCFGPPHRLSPLSHNDALTLFYQSPVLEDRVSKLLDEDLVDKIVTHCKGSPLALTVIGKSLSGMDHSIWKSKLLEWSEGLSLVDSNPDILQCLKKSLDDLEGLAWLKECFMDLGSFPVDHVIPSNALIDMWVEMYGLDAEGIQANSILHELASRSLIDLLVTRKDASEGISIYSDVFITQHDLLRELAIHQNSQGPIEQRERLNVEIHGNKFPEWWNPEQRLPLKARLVSISTDDKFSTLWPEIDLPTVEVLILIFHTERYTLPPFIEKMTNLKSLIVRSNAFSSAEITNLPILDSLTDLKRIRLERVKVPSITLSCKHLNNLEKASFFFCSIGDESVTVPKVLPNLTELDISYCNHLQNLPDEICDITTLKKISVTNCHNLTHFPERIGNLLNLEVLRLSSCTSLLGLHESIGKLENLSYLDLSDCFSIEKLPDEMGSLCKLKELHVKGCLSLTAMPLTIRKLEQLKYAICDAQRAILWRSIKIYLPKLHVKVVEEDINLNWLRIN